MTVPRGAEATTLDAPTEVPVGAPAAGRRGLSSSGRTRALRIAQRQGLLVVLAGLILTFAIASPYFFTSSNLLTVGGTAGVLGLMAITQTFLIISGGIDISVGSNVACSGMILGTSYSHGMNIWVASLLAVAFGTGIGALNGLISVVLKVNPLVTTLGTFSIFGGLAFVIGGGTQVLTIDDSAFLFLGAGGIGTVPFTLVLFAAVLAVGLVVERLTTFGRGVYAIGGNLEAARLAGLRIDLGRFLLFVLSGMSAGVVGVILVSQLATASPNVGAAFMLSVVTACILGGASLLGGRGTLVGTTIAVAILGVLQNGFALLEFSAYMQTLVLGVLLILAVLLDETLRRLET